MTNGKMLLSAALLGLVAMMSLSSCQSAQQQVIARDNVLGWGEVAKPSEAVPLSFKSYRVTIDCDQSIDQMVVAGKYDGMNATEILSASNQLKCSGKAEVVLSLILLGSPANDIEAGLSLRRLGCSPGLNEHLLAFGAKFPDKQRESPIVALGSNFVDQLGRRHVNYLDSRYGNRLGKWDPDEVWERPQRLLHLYSMVSAEGLWPANSLFLAVCERP